MCLLGVKNDGDEDNGNDENDNLKCSHLLSAYDMFLTVLKTFNSTHTHTHTHTHVFVLTRILAGENFITLILQRKRASDQVNNLPKSLVSGRAKTII